MARIRSPPLRMSPRSLLPLTLVLAAALAAYAAAPEGEKPKEDASDDQQEPGEQSQWGDGAPAGPFAVREPNFLVMDPSGEVNYHSVFGVARHSPISKVRESFRAMAARFREPLMKQRSPPFVTKKEEMRRRREVAAAARRSAGLDPVVEGGEGGAPPKEGGEGGEGGEEEVFLTPDQRAREEERRWRMEGSDAAAIGRFVKATEAYTVMTNADRKRVYEASGSEGLFRRLAGPRFEDPMRDAYKLELEFKTGHFEMEFGFREGQKKSTGNVHHNLKIPLLGFYQGFTMDVAIVRSELCSMCNGTGAAQDAEMLTCHKCTGTGKLATASHWRSKRARRERREGGFDQTVTLGCRRCLGSGKLPSEPCPGCKGERTVDGQTSVKVVVEPGVLEGQSYTFKEQAEQAPDAVSGDVVLHVGAEEHEDFEREGNDLVCRRNITLAQALLGFKMVVTHLDGREIDIERDEVTKPGQDHVVAGMGMPIHGKPGEFGNMVVKLNIVFPERIAVDEERTRNLRRADERAKKRRKAGWRGMFGGGGGGEAEEEEPVEEEGGEQEEEDEEGYEDRQTSTRRGRRKRTPSADEASGDPPPPEGGGEAGGGAGAGAAGGAHPEGEGAAADAASPPPKPPSQPKGVGMHVQPLYEDGGVGKVQVGLRVKGLLPGSPAEMSGKVHVGDMLVQVGGVSVGGMKLKQLAPLLLGEEGSTVRLMLRGADGADKEVDLVRGDPVAPKEEL